MKQRYTVVVAFSGCCDTCCKHGYTVIETTCGHWHNTKDAAEKCLKKMIRLWDADEEEYCFRYGTAEVQGYPDSYGFVADEADLVDGYYIGNHAKYERYKQAEEKREQAEELRKQAEERRKQAEEQAERQNDPKIWDL